MNKKIAIPTTENGILDGHFGHCRYFEILEIANNQIVSQSKLVPPPHEPGILPKWIVQNGVTDLIVGGIGDRASKILQLFDVSIHKGAATMEATKLV